MKEKSKRAKLKIEYGNGLGNSIFWLSVGLLFLVPLAFSTAVQGIYSLPKFVLLLVGGSVIALLLTLYASRHSQLIVPLFKSNHVKLVCAYFVVVALSTVFSVAPRVSVFGSSSNFMGLITRLCFFICFFGLIAGIGASEGRLLKTLWAIVISGGIVATYAVAQFFGIEPFAPTSVYTFSTSLGDVIRVCSSIGHSNYLGNFLLYITPLSAALALATNKRARLFAAIITAMSLLAIVFSVARGAWVGIIVGMIFFVILELKYAPAKPLINRKNLLRYAAIILLFSSVIISIIAFTPASRSIKERVQALITQGVSSSGRIILWRDSLKMLPAFALTGAGSEGFRKALLLYKSKELAKLSQPDNNESSHNSYLDVALSHGLLGLVLYLAIIISTLTTFLRLRRRITSPSWRIIISGVAASFVAVLAHNFFIFDQLSTGLYFFAFVALASAMTNVFGANAVQEKALPQTSQAGEKVAKPQDQNRFVPTNANPKGLRRWASHAATALAALAFVVAVWYSAGLIKAELAFGKIFDPRIARNFQAITKRCEEAANSPLPTGAYNYRVAKALETYAQELLKYSKASDPSSAEGKNLLTTRSAALQLAIAYAEKSLAHTNTPDLNYSLLAALALTAGDVEKLNLAAAEAIRCDPNGYQARWLMAEAHLARGEKEQAAREAEIALEIKHVSPEASFALARAQGGAYTDAEISAARQRSIKLKRSVEEVIEAAHKLSQEGQLKKARLKLLTALASTDGNCADCHRELAIVYEKMGRFADALTEWDAFLTQTSEPALVEQTKAHMKILQQKPDVKP